MLSRLCCQTYVSNLQTRQHLKLEKNAGSEESAVLHQTLYCLKYQLHEFPILREFLLSGIISHDEYNYIY